MYQLTFICMAFYNLSVRLFYNRTVINRVYYTSTMLRCQHQTVMKVGADGEQLLSQITGFAGGSRLIPTAGGGLFGNEAASVQPI